MCQVCNWDEDSDAMPGMMYLERLAPDGEPTNERVYVGRCDRCQAVHVRCSCGTVTGIYESMEGEPFECLGCGRTITVDPTELDGDAIPINENPHERVHLGPSPS